MTLRLILTLAAAAFATGAQARPAARTIHVQQGWSRPTTGGAPAVGYLKILNTAAAPDHLSGGSSPLAAAVSLHRSTMRGQVMSMRAVPGGVDIPARGQLMLEPHGYHLMLEGVKRPLRAGDWVPLDLQFRRAGKVHAILQVRAGPEPMRMP